MEKYEKITPTPLDKKPREDDTPKVITTHYFPLTHIFYEAYDKLGNEVILSCFIQNNVLKIKLISFRLSAHLYQRASKVNRRVRTNLLSLDQRKNLKLTNQR